jgi:hypothetical protein
MEFLRNFDKMQTARKLRAAPRSARARAKYAAGRAPAFAIGSTKWRSACRYLKQSVFANSCRKWFLKLMTSAFLPAAVVEDLNGHVWRSLALQVFMVSFTNSYHSYKSTFQLSYLSHLFTVWWSLADDWCIFASFRRRFFTAPTQQFWCPTKSCFVAWNCNKNASIQWIFVILMFVVYFEASQRQYCMASCWIAVNSTRSIFGNISRPPNTRVISQKK